MKIFIVGCGSWALALASVLLDNKHQVLLYSNDVNQVLEINNNHTSQKFYPGLNLNHDIKAVNNIEAINNYDLCLLAVPSSSLRVVIELINQKLKKKMIFINTAKGFDMETGESLSSLLRKGIKDEYLEAVVSLIGPSHAEEVIVKGLTLVNAVSSNHQAANLVQKLFSNQYFRVYTNSDEVACELLVAVKNVMAIASGMLYGLGYGDNARAALITRAINEMKRLVESYQLNSDSIIGLCGIGDLIVTCTSFHSRNFQAGVEIVKNYTSASEFLKHNTKTVEGINACKIVHQIAQEKGVEMPIVESIYQVLFNNQQVDDQVKVLMTRPLKEEFDKND